MSKNVNSLNYFKVDCYYRSILAILLHHDKTLLPVALLKYGFFNFIDDILSFDKVDICDFDRILNDLSIKRFFVTVDRNDFIYKICENLNNKKSIVLWIDLYYNYLFPSVYKKIHVRHSVPVFDFSEKDQNFQVIDSDYVESALPIKTTISFPSIKECFFSYVDFFKSENIIHVLDVEKNIKSFSNHELNRKYINVYHDFLVRNYDLIIGYLLNMKEFFKNTSLKEWILKNDLEKIKKCNLLYIAFNNAVLNYQNLYAIAHSYMKKEKSIKKRLERHIDLLNYLRAIFYKFKMTQFIDIDLLSKCTMKFEAMILLEIDMINNVVEYFTVECLR